MALQKSRKIKNTDITATNAYIRVLQDNTIYDWENITGKVSVAIYSSEQARIDNDWPFEVVVYQVVPSVDTTVEEYDAANLSQIDASIWLSESIVSADWVTARIKIYEFLKTQDLFSWSVDV